MNKYCPICFRKISVNKNGKIYRHGFKRNRWICEKLSFTGKTKYKKVDGDPCQGTGKLGMTIKQLERN